MIFSESFVENASRVKAKVAQKLAIAERISTSEVVEIEDYFDTNGKGNAGFGKFFLGIGGSGQRVAKRTVRLIGKRDNK